MPIYRSNTFLHFVFLQCTLFIQDRINPVLDDEGIKHKLNNTTVVTNDFAVLRVDFLRCVVDGMNDFVMAQMEHANEKSIHQDLLHFGNGHN